MASPTTPPPSPPQEKTPAELYGVVTTPWAEKLFEEVDRMKEAPNFDRQRQLIEPNMRVAEFYRSKMMTLRELAVKRKVCDILVRDITSAFAFSHISMSGSIVSRMGSRGSDMDMVFTFKHYEDEFEEEGAPTNNFGSTDTLRVLNLIRNVLVHKPYLESAETIYARNPILKVRMRPFPYDNIEIDIGGNKIGVYNSHLLRYLAMHDRRVPQLVVILKEWAKFHGVVNPSKGLLNPYTITMMLVHFLQCGVDPPILPNLIALYPQHFAGKQPIERLSYREELHVPVIPRNGRTLIELLYGFFRYYIDFDYAKQGISISEARVFDRSEKQAYYADYPFFLEEAYDGIPIPKNISASDLEWIVGQFRKVISCLLVDLLGL